MNTEELIKDMQCWLGLSREDKREIIKPRLIKHREKADWNGDFEQRVLSDHGLEVLDAFHQVTIGMLNRGNTHIGTRYALEVIRQMPSKTTGDGLFKINNIYARSYTYLLKLLHPDLKTVYTHRSPPGTARQVA